jgi:tRNA-dihydrouridine synthase B
MNTMLPWFANNAFPLYLAPMARFTDITFRAFCKRQGADVLVSEFVMSEALLRDDPRVWETVAFTPEQRPMGVQIFGSCKESMASAARLVEERIAPDFIDLNFGCPADRVTCMDAGSSLLRHPSKLASIVEAVVKRVQKTPVTVKMRLGWAHDSIVAHEVARLVEEAGAQAIAIHGRTKEQGYSGEADWETIDAVARERSVPVIANGNIRSAADVLYLQQKTACAGAMIGRAAQGYPWIFSEIKYYREHGTLPEPPTVAERWETLIDYARQVLARPYNADYANDLRWMRPKLLSLTKEMPGARRLRGAIGKVVHLADIEALAAEHLRQLEVIDCELVSTQPAERETAD